MISGEATNRNVFRDSRISGVIRPPQRKTSIPRAAQPIPSSTPASERSGGYLRREQAANDTECHDGGTNPVNEVPEATGNEMLVVTHDRSRRLPVVHTSAYPRHPDTGATRLRAIAFSHIGRAQPDVAIGVLSGQLVSRTFYLFSRAKRRHAMAQANGQVI